MEKISFLFSEFNIGGMESSMIRIARSMNSSQKYEAIFITTEKKSMQIPDDIKYIHIEGFNKFLPYAHFIKVKNTINNLNISIHLIVFERIFQSILPFINGIKIGMLRNNHPDIYKRAFVNFSYIDGFIGNSPANELYVNKQKNKLNKFFRFIPNGISFKNNHEVKKIVSKDCLNILFVGRIIDESKGVFGLYESCAILVDKNINFTLTVVGEGEDLLKLKNLFKDNIFRNKIFFKPFLYKDDLVAEYQKAHILLLPSNYEGLPNVLIEAQLYGCVPIATHLINSTDLVINNEVNGFLFKKKDYSEMADIIIKLSEDKDKIHNISKAAHKNILENFSSDIEYTRYDEAINEIKSRRVRKPLFKRFSLELFKPTRVFKDLLKYLIKKCT
jgi:glycosyltransferase involved in cell wall biosynthesis